jgi:hypothetical protein
MDLLSYSVSHDATRDAWFTLRKSGAKLFPATIKTLYVENVDEN